MIAGRMLSMWDDLVESLALIAIIFLALCVMVGAVKVGDVLRHLGAIAGTAIMLIMLPAIIVGLWSTMSFLQHLGLVLLIAALVYFIGSIRRKPVKRRTTRNT